MHRLRWKITVLVGSAILLMLLSVMCAFNFIMQRRMQKNAETALRSLLLPSTLDNSEPSLYSPEVIAVFDTEEMQKTALAIYTQKESSILEWCEGREPGIVRKTEIGGNSYFLLVADKNMLAQEENIFTQEEGGIFIGEFSFGVDETFPIDTDDETIGTGMLSVIADTESLREAVGYVDITGELEMIRQINFVFLISALVTGFLGGASGYLTGRKLEQSEIAQKRFFENTSHELKTPLTSIRGYAEGIEKGIITDYARTGRTIAAQTDKMTRLVEEILCVARLESGSVVLKKEPVELSAFIQDCLMPFEGTVLSRGLEVTLDLSPLTVSADPDKLEHALSNLLTNALKYARTKIRITCVNNTITISNDCEPLDEDTLSHLFERFYTGRDGNTGIGLCIARELIGLHGWRITAGATEEGICFTVRLK